MEAMGRCTHQAVPGRVLVNVPVVPFPGTPSDLIQPDFFLVATACALKRRLVQFRPRLPGSMVRDGNKQSTRSQIPLFSFLRSGVGGWDNTACAALSPARIRFTPTLRRHVALKHVRCEAFWRNVRRKSYRETPLVFAIRSWYWMPHQ